MTESVQRLKGEIEGLSSAERADLALYLLHSLDGEEESDAEAAWDAELAGRLEEIETGKAVGIPAEQVMAELRRKYA